MAVTWTRHVGNDPDGERCDQDRGWMNSPSSINQARHRFKAISSTVAGMDARSPAAPAGDLGQVRPFVRPGEPERYRRDVPNAQVYVVDVGHFALDTAADEIAALVRGFECAQETARQPSWRRLSVCRSETLLGARGVTTIRVRDQSRRLFFSWSLSEKGGAE
jgi:hypothetical protein